MTRKRERSVRSCRSEAENSHGAEPAGTCAAPLSDLPPTTPAPTVHDERNVKLQRPALPGACDVSDSRPDERESLQPEPVPQDEAAAAVTHLRVTTASSTSELQVVPDGATTENSSHDKPGSSKPSKAHGRERQSPRMVEAIIRSLPGRVLTVTCLLPGRRRVLS